MDTKQLPKFKITKIIPEEDEDGNLINLDCELEPVNLIAQIIDTTEDFIEVDKLIEIPSEIIEEIERIKSSYGDKNLIPDD